MKALPVDIQKFMLVHKQLAHVKYGLGSKARNASGRLTLTAKPNEFNSIDCSGYFRYLIYHSANGFMIPDGSWIQREWCEGSGLEQVSYSWARQLKDTLWVAFATPGVKGVGKVGHVWLGWNDFTYESYSGNGVGSLPAGNSWRVKHVHKTFIWPTTNLTVTPAPYSLYQSNGALIAKLPDLGGTTYVPARKWAAWQGIPIHWDGKNVLYGGTPVGSDVQLMEGMAYIPFKEAALYSGVGYDVDIPNREIHLRAKGR